MYANIIKIIDTTILPVALMVVSKFIGLAFAISIFRIEWDLQNIMDGFWLIRPAVGEADLALVSTYADLIMYMLLAVAFSFVLLQAIQFHDSHINPRMLVRLHNYNLGGLVKGSMEIYRSATIWLIILWIATIITWVDIQISGTEAWVPFVTTLSSTIFTAILLQDVYKEIDLSKRTLATQSAFS